jgi:hypothetical protein
MRFGPRAAKGACVQILMTERLLPRHCSMDDLDETYRPVFAGAVVKDI